MKNVYLNSLIKREKRKKYAIGLCTDMVMRVGVYMWRCDGKKAKRIIGMVLGFLFGVYAYIITLFIKPREPEFDEIEIQRRIAEDKVQAMKRDISTGKVWVCPQCGKMNDRYETICSCGTQKPIHERL